MRNALAALTVSIVLVACSERSAVGPTPSLALRAAESVSHAPVLLHPAEGTRIDQNQQTLPCSPSTSGRGYRINFVWNGIDNPQVAGYQLLVKKAATSEAMLRIQVTQPLYALTSCNSFVADGNLEGWQWMARAVGVDGTLGPWSPAINFGFKPCRLGGGTPCFTGGEE